MRRSSADQIPVTPLVVKPLARPVSADEVCECEFDLRGIAVRPLPLRSTAETRGSAIPQRGGAVNWLV